MSESKEFIFNNEYCERVKRFRGETNMSAEEMANLLGIPPDRYRKYESRSPMPVYLIPDFCRIVGCDLEHLILGKARERLKPVLIARKLGLSDLDMIQRIDALEIDRQQVAKAVAETSSSQASRNRKRGTLGN